MSQTITLSYVRFYMLTFSRTKNQKKSSLDTGIQYVFMLSTRPHAVIMMWIDLDCCKFKGKSN
jgi:hypothetical protein